MMYPHLAFICLLSLYCVQVARAECPNGCSGKGTCGLYDMCTCYKNYQGNDCSQRTCPFDYAHVDTPKGDLNMDQTQKSAGTNNDYWVLTNSQVYPYGTYEWFSPNAKDGEAHFYMECSNKGLCDRTTGLCVCFDGFEGSACQRASCPNKCSGHGTCESIAELGKKVTGTLYGKGEGKGNTAVAYELWDAKKSYGCRCDPWYGGPDCSKRKCKVGIDPLYEANGNEILDTWILRATVRTDGTANPAETYDPTINWIQLRLFDYWGESFTTGKIYFPASSADVTIENAIQALPQFAFAGIDCAIPATANTFASGINAPKSTNHQGILVACQFVTNPGIMRLPEIVAINIANSARSNTAVSMYTTDFEVSITGSIYRGEDEDWFTTKSNCAIATMTSGSTSLAFTNPTTGTADLTNALRLIKLNSQICLILSVTGTTATLKYNYVGPDMTSSDSILLSQATIVADAATVNAWTVGSKQFTASAAPGTAAVKSLLYIQGQFFYVESITGTTVVVDRPFQGKVANGASIAAAEAIYVVTPPTTGKYRYVSECSGRGMCGRDTGVCTCFKGYTNDNCDTQNMLAL